MIQLDTLIQILVGVFVIGGGIVGFFTMQKGQNMRIAQLEKDMQEMKSAYEKELEMIKATNEKALTEVRRKQSISTTNQIKTEKDLVAINAKLDHILEAIGEIKNERSNHNARVGD